VITLIEVLLAEVSFTVSGLLKLYFRVAVPQVNVATVVWPAPPNPGALMLSSL
jgi:hypothetical protein